MTLKRFKQLVAGLLFFLVLDPSAALHAQKDGRTGKDEVRFIYLDSPANEYVDYLINSGRVIPEYVFLQPYELDPVFWVNSTPAARYFQNYWQKFYGGYDASAQFTAGDKVILDDSLTNRYRFSGGVHYVAPHITLANRTIVDEDYKYDDYFAGDLSESEDWLYGRVNDAYLNLRFSKFDLFFGRMHRNWGSPNFPSLILSDHAYTYDHLLASYTTRHFKLSLIFAQLEDLAPGLEVGSTRNPDSTTVYPNARKYLVGHRLDIRFSERFQLAFSEVATYGGPNRDIEPAFFNPMNFYYPIQRNDRRLMNGHWSLDAFYKPTDRASLYLQFLLDDVIVNNDPGVDDRGRYPDRLGVSAAVRSADILAEGFNAGLTYTRIWNRTYQSRWNWENYHYRGLSLGFPCASCEEVKVDLAYWGLFPLFIKNELTVGRYGSVQLTDLFRGRKEPFPVEPVIDNIVNHLTLQYFLSTVLEFHADVRYLKDSEHYSNRIDLRDKFFFSAGVRLNLNAGFPVQ